MTTKTRRRQAQQPNHISHFLRDLQERYPVLKGPPLRNPEPEPLEEILGLADCSGSVDFESEVEELKVIDDFLRRIGPRMFVDND